MVCALHRKNIENEDLKKLLASSVKSKKKNKPKKKKPSGAGKEAEEGAAPMKTDGEATEEIAKEEEVRVL